MSGYGLQLRKKPAAARPALPPPAPGFGADDDEDDVERDISRQAAVNRAKKEVEAAHKKALEEDASIFDYDGAYDKFKVENARPLMQDRQERKPKYIQKLLDKAKEREREHEVIYEKKLLRERAKDDHLYADKEKFVTSAYKKKLAEQAKWLEEERLRGIREDREDVTKKSDLSDFYFNLNKNVALGAGHPEPSRSPASGTAADTSAEERGDFKAAAAAAAAQEDASASPRRAPESEREADTAARGRSFPTTEDSSTPAPEKKADDVEQAPPEGQKAGGGRYERSEDAVAAARERYLARKKARAK